MNNAFYIIGTDTACGKTIVAGAIAAYLRHIGRQVGVMKPFESACDDSAFLREMANSDDAMELINPYHFDEPLAPAVAAERAQQHADLAHIVSTFNSLRSKHEILLAEGAGGLLVPLIGKLTHVELLKELNVPVLVVARLGLGTINHTLLTLEVLKKNAIPCTGVILNEMQPASTVAEATNADVLKRYYDVPLLGTVAYVQDHGNAEKLRQALPEELQRFLQNHL